MKWYTSEPRKDCPILIKSRKDFNQEYFCVVEYYEDGWSEYVTGQSSMTWEKEDILAWTDFKELEKDIQKF